MVPAIAALLGEVSHVGDRRVSGLRGNPPHGEGHLGGRYELPVPLHPADPPWRRNGGKRGAPAPGALPPDDWLGLSAVRRLPGCPLGPGANPMRCICAIACVISGPGSASIYWRFTARVCSSSSGDIPTIAQRSASGQGLRLAPLSQRELLRFSRFSQTNAAHAAQCSLARSVRI